MSSSDKKLVTVTKKADYSKVIIGKDMTKKSDSSSSSSATATPKQSSSSSEPADPNPMSSSGYAKWAKAKGLPVTAPVRPSF